jgi:uncharacterized protein YdeI (YjbR/CyaY-like superfamily)
VKPTFFATRAEFRAWLERHHEDADELWVGFYKKASGKPSITWPEAVDQALCFGWIDGVRRSLGDESYANRFTPRRKGSNWSAKNIRRAEQLIELGLMRPAGLAAFEARSAAAYSYEERSSAELGPEFERELRGNPKAWEFFQSQPPWYRRTAAYWVVSARKEETRRRRLATLIADSEHGRTIAPLTRPK